MFRPRHAYRSPITNRYRGKAKGCPVFNNVADIQSNMVEQHDECLECLSRIKNRNDLYRTLADNNKPSNNVIKSLQKLSHSASNNRLKTCLQFLIIKVNEKSIVTPHQQTASITKTTTATSSANTITNSNNSSPKSIDSPMEITRTNEHSSILNSKHQNKRQRLHGHNQQKLHQNNINNNRQKLNQIASPPQDLVSSTQDQIGPAQDDHDCQTSPSMLVSTQTDDLQDIQPDQGNGRHDSSKQEDSPTESTIKLDEANNHRYRSQQTTHSSPALNYASTTTTALTPTTTNATTSTSPSRTTETNETNESVYDATKLRHSNGRNLIDRKRRKLQNGVHHETSPIDQSWSTASYASPPSPISSESSTSSISSESSCSSSCSSSSYTSASPSHSPSPSPLSSPDIINELRGPRLKLSEEKIRKIKKRPVSFDDCYDNEHSFASTPTTSSGCSPGQHSNTTQNSEHSRSGFPISNPVIHTFQAPPKFVNYLKPCNLPARPQNSSQTKTPPPQTKEMLNCAICGIKEKLPNISKTFGQNSCPLCTKFFAAFLKQPQQLYCAQDGDCLMTFDRRCQACWIKICLQKFDIEEELRKIGYKYSPKLLSAPNVSLITIDTSLNR